MIEELQGCCGIGVIFELSENDSSFDTLLELYRECQTRAEYYDYKEKKTAHKDLAPRFGLVIWSDATVYRQGKALAAYIRKHKLGLVSKSYQANNPNNEEHTIEHWTWKVDWKKYFTHMKKRLDKS